MRQAAPRAPGCQGLDEGHSPALCSLLYLGTRQPASCCCWGMLRGTALARAGGGPRRQQQVARCPRVSLISVMYFPLTFFSLPWQQHRNCSPSSWPCGEAKFKKPEARFGMIAKGSEMTIMAVTESYRRKNKAGSIIQVVILCTLIWRFASQFADTCPVCAHRFWDIRTAH